MINQVAVLLTLGKSTSSKSSLSVLMQSGKAAGEGGRGDGGQEGLPDFRHLPEHLFSACLLIS